MKPVLPQVCTRYEIRNPVYHLIGVLRGGGQGGLAPPPPLKLVKV